MTVLVSWGCHNKIPRLRGISNRQLFSYGSGGCQSKARCQRGQFLVRALISVCEGGGVLLCVPTTSSVCTFGVGRESSPMSLLIRILILSGQGPFLIPHLTVITSKYSFMRVKASPQN